MTQGTQRIVIQCLVLAAILTSTARANTLYVINSGDNTVVKLTPPSGTITPFASTDTPYGLAFDPSGNLFVVNSVTSGSVSKVTPSGTVSVFATGFNNASGITFDSSGNLFVALFRADEVSEFNSSGQLVSNYTGFHGPIFLAIEPSAVPEPSSMMLIGLGAAGLIGYRWRCRKQPDKANPLF